MAISGRDLAILTARYGCARYGASRFGFCPDDVEGVGADEPGEYVWKEDKPPTTTWTLESRCEGNVCGYLPTASFTFTPESGLQPLSVAFTNTSKHVGDDGSYLWDFGDGETSTEENPTHVFASDGTFTVTLTVTNGRGTDSATDSVTVIPATGVFQGTLYSNVALTNVVVNIYEDYYANPQVLVAAVETTSLGEVDPPEGWEVPGSVYAWSYSYEIATASYDLLPESDEYGSAEILVVDQTPPETLDFFMVLIG